jgi:hypothetical protein
MSLGHGLPTLAIIYPRFAIAAPTAWVAMIAWIEEEDRGEEWTVHFCLFACLAEGIKAVLHDVVQFSMPCQLKRLQEYSVGVSTLFRGKNVDSY